MFSSVSLNGPCYSRSVRPWFGHSVSRLGMGAASSCPIRM